jgi:hypothetical protein
MKRHLGWGLCVALLLTGCQRLNMDKEKDLEAGESYYYFLDPPKYAQDIKVEFKSEEAVSGAILKAKDEDEAAKALTDFVTGKKDNVLASKFGTSEKEYTLETKVEANTPVTVYVRNAGKKATKVSVKIRGR